MASEVSGIRKRMYNNRFVARVFQPKRFLQKSGNKAPSVSLCTDYIEDLRTSALFTEHN